MPKISVIVPVYKVEQYLDRCVKSILNQTFTDFELILVDDGSPDNCPAMCDEYAKRDERVVVIHQENGGLSAARNAGIDWAFANSDSEWLTFIDSDDWVHEEYLERMYNAAVENDVAISVCGYERTVDTFTFTSDHFYSSDLWVPEDFYIEHNINSIIACAKLYKKSLFGIIRYPLKRIHEDEFTTYKVLFQCTKIAVIDKPLYAYYINEESIMSTSNVKKRVHLLDALEEQLLFFKGKKLFNAQKSAIEKSMISIGIIFDEAKKAEEKEIVYIMRKKARKLILQYRNIYHFSVKKCNWFYEIAFPNVMKIYWTIIGVLK